MQPVRTTYPLQLVSTEQLRLDATKNAHPPLEGKSALNAGDVRRRYGWTDRFCPFNPPIKSYFAAAKSESRLEILLLSPSRIRTPGIRKSVSSLPSSGDVENAMMIAAGR